MESVCFLIIMLIISVRGCNNGHLQWELWWGRKVFPTEWPLRVQEWPLASGSQQVPADPLSATLSARSRFR